MMSAEFLVKRFHEDNPKKTVLALLEGTFIGFLDNEIMLYKGSGRCYKKNKKAKTLTLKNKKTTSITRIVNSNN